MSVASYSSAQKVGAETLVRALREPVSAAALSEQAWTDLVAVARAESLLGSLAHRCAGLDLPAPVAAALADARDDVAAAQRQAVWEAEMARRALAPLGIPVILLKGTAYAAADLPAAEGRAIGDLDILVAREALPQVEAALLGAGWEWVKDDPYDQHYYRTWMHELPPLIHRERDRMIDVHHTILPLTANPKPQPASMIADSVILPSGLRILAPCDMIVHAAAHLFADGDLAGGLRNLWDIDRLLRHFSADAEFWPQLDARTAHHDLTGAVGRALSLAHRLYGTPVPERWRNSGSADRLLCRRLLARNCWGQQTRPATRLAFYIRSHWLRMPPLMLARHLWTKLRR